MTERDEGGLSSPGATAAAADAATSALASSIANTTAQPQSNDPVIIDHSVVFHGKGLQAAPAPAPPRDRGIRDAPHFDQRGDGPALGGPGGGGGGGGGSGLPPSSVTRANEPIDPEMYRHKIREPSKCIGVFGFGTRPSMPDQVVCVLLL